MTTQFDQLMEQQTLQSGMMEHQTALMGHMAGSLNSLQGEMRVIRQMNLQGLAIQQEMLQREQLQSQLEEFIYNTQKMTDEFGDDSCQQPASVRYFSLLGVTKTVEELGIGTALIRGRDNKAAFDASMADVTSIVSSLENDPDVVEALAWVKEEAKRLDEQSKQQRRLQEEEQAARAKKDTEREAKRSELLRQIAELEEQRPSATFSDWHNEKFGPLSLKVILLWYLFGFIWIPVVWGNEKEDFQNGRADSSLEAAISKLQKKLSKGTTDIIDTT